MTLVVDWYNHLIQVTSPQTEVLIQDLYNFTQDVQGALPGMNYTDICSATGKDELDEGVATGITLNLNSPWQLQFWNGNYIATIKGGNLVGGLVGDPIAYTPNVQVLVIQSAASTIVTTGGSALTTEEHDKLMTGLDISVPNGVWEELRASHVTTGTYGLTSEWADKSDICCFKYVASDDGSLIGFGVWGEQFGETILDLDSIAMKLFDIDGNELADLGTQASQSSEGVFKFTTASTSLTSASSNYVNVVVSRGVNTWSYNFGLAVAG